MKLTNIAYRMGEKVVTNQDLLDLVVHHSKEHFQGDLDNALSKINHLFKKSGADTRRWLGEGQSPLPMVCEAIDEVLEKAELATGDIDLMMHVGLGRGFLEAGQAYFIAQAKKMHRVHCFDVMDACNSWTRGLFLAQNMLKTGAYKRVLLVNTECNMMPGGIINPSCFKLEKFEDIDHCFPGMTLGDAVSATIVEPDEENPWDFDFMSRVDCADLCAVPLDNYEHYSMPSKYLAKNGTHRFTSFGSLMQKKTMLEFGMMITKNRIKRPNIDWLFPHGHTRNQWEVDGSRAWQIPAEKMKWNTYGQYGNFASACVPISIAQGMESGEVKRGHQVMTAVASGGLSFSSAAFTL